MTTVHITPEELTAGTTQPDHLASAVEAIERDGFVVLADVVDRGHVAALRDKLLDDLAVLKARPDAPYNWNAGNIQQDPPPFPPYLFRDVLVNDMVTAVTHTLLGDGVRNAYYSGNTALPSTERQPVHADTGHLWPGREPAAPPFGLVVNVPLVDMSPANGSTEIWPGTHHDTTVGLHGDIKVPPEAIARWRGRVMPIQPTVSAGSVLIRDLRLWHAGVPNGSNAPRPMIAMIHYASWFTLGDPLRFPRGTEPFFEHPTLRTHAVFVDGHIDYIHAPHAFEYTHDQ